MAQLPLEEAIERFKGNEERIDQFVNDADGYTSSGGQPVESLPAFLSRVEQEVGTVADNLAAAQAAQSAAEAAAAAVAAAPTSIAAVPVPVYDTYTAGRNATADLQLFGVRTADNTQVRIYRKENSAGTLLAMQPYIASPGADTIAALVQGRATAGVLPPGVVADMDSSQAIYGHVTFTDLAFKKRRPIEGIPAGWATHKLHDQAIGGSNGATVTRAYNGENAFRVAAPAASSGNAPYVWMTPAMNLPAGRWTLAIELETPAGAADCSVRVHHNYFQSLPGTSVLANVTGTRQTVTLTFELTTDSAIYPAISATTHAPSQAFDVVYRGLRITPGGTDVVTPALAGPIFLTQTLTAMPRSGAAINLAATTLNGFMPARLAFDGFTFLAAVSAADVANQLQVLFAGSSRDEPSTNNFRASYGANSDGVFLGHFSLGEFLNAPPTQSAVANILNINRLGWCVLGVTADANGQLMTLNGVPICQTAAYITQKMLQVFSLSGVIKFGGLWSGAVLANRRFSLEEMRSASEVLINRVTLKGLSFSDFTHYAIYEGDSNTSNAVGWASRSHRHLAPQMQGINMAVGGATLKNNAGNDLYSRLPAVLELIAYAKARGKTVVVVPTVGTNDTGRLSSTAGVDSYWADLTWYWAQLRAAGSLVVPGTVIAQQATTYDVGRNDLNARIRGAVAAGLVNAVADLAAAPELSVWSATHYTDSLHPKSSGHEAGATGYMFPAIKTATGL